MSSTSSTGTSTIVYRVRAGTMEAGLQDVAVGDRARLDNSIYLAAQTHHRHIAHTGSPDGDEFHINGKTDLSPAPRAPCRSDACPRDRAVRLQDDRHVESHGRRPLVPIQADYYRRLIEEHLGSA